MLMLQVIKGPDRGRVYPLPEGEPQLIGRSTEALPMEDTAVSRRHAELTPDDGTWYVRDLDSANGTMVNGEPLTGRRKLSPGDELACGETVFRLIDSNRDIGGPIGSLEQERLASRGPDGRHDQSRDQEHPAGAAWCCGCHRACDLAG